MFYFHILLLFQPYLCRHIVPVCLIHPSPVTPDAVLNSAVMQPTHKNQGRGF